MSEQVEQTDRAGTGAAPGGCGGHHRTARQQERPGEAPAPAGVVPGRKAGNLLGLRDVSAPAPSQGGGCGCGGHGHGGRHAHGRCGCGSY